MQFDALELQVSSLEIFIQSGSFLIIFALDSITALLQIFGWWLFDSLCVDSHLTTFKFELEISQNGTYFRNTDEEIFCKAFSLNW